MSIFVCHLCTTKGVTHNYLGSISHYFQDLSMDSSLVFTIFVSPWFNLPQPPTMIYPPSIHLPKRLQKVHIVWRFNNKIRPNRPCWVTRPRAESHSWPLPPTQTGACTMKSFQWQDRQCQQVMWLIVSFFCFVFCFCFFLNLISIFSLSLSRPKMSWPYGQYCWKLNPIN